MSNKCTQSSDVRPRATFLRDVPVIARSRELKGLSDLIRWSLLKLREA